MGARWAAAAGARRPWGARGVEIHLPDEILRCHERRSAPVGTRPSQPENPLVKQQLLVKQLPPPLT